MSEIKQDDRVRYFRPGVQPYDGVVLRLWNSVAWLLPEGWDEPMTVAAEYLTLLPSVAPPLPERWAVMSATGFVFGGPLEESAREAFRRRHMAGDQILALVHIWTDESGVDRAVIERVPTQEATK